MNLPNKLTVLRVFMIPFFLVFFYVGKAGLWNSAYEAAFFIFVLASFTDLLDGKIARKRGLVTDFGKLMDPLADKLLVMSAMVCFISVEIVHPVVVIVILSREFLVTSIRLMAASGGAVLAADGWGKIKTVFQMAWVSYGLLLCALSYGSFGFTPETLPAAFGWVNTGLIVAVTALTVMSGARYVWKNRSLFADF